MSLTLFSRSLLSKSQFPISTALKHSYHSAAASASATDVNTQISEAIGLPVKACDLLTHALDTHVPSLGFTEKAVLFTLKDHGYSSAARSVFPDSSRGGELDLVLTHLARSRILMNQEAESIIEQKNSSSTSSSNPTASSTTPNSTTNVSVRELLFKRLLLNEPVAHHLAEAQAILTQPGNVPMSLSELHKLSDDIWYYAGDRSHSFDWYSKRLTLSSLYVAAELVMSQDRSSNYRDTLEFVQRRLSELENAKYAVDSVTEWSSFFARSSYNVFQSLWARG